MPVTEAMACGTDAVVSESSSLIEISAGLVPLIDPKNADLWAESMEEKLNFKADDRKRQQLIDHARSYTWDKTAEAARSAIKYASMV